MSNEEAKLFGANVKKFRKAKGYTQVRLAIFAGLSEDHISQIERGIATPSFKSIEAIAEVLNVPMKDLFDF